MKKFFITLFLLIGTISLCAHAATNQRLELNKKNVMAFYDLAFNKDKPKEAMDKYAGATYTQHNPQVSDGKSGFIAYFTRMAKEYPGKQIHFKRVLAEGNFVIVHSLQEWPAHDNWASMDIFRLDKNGKIVEHWDVLQRVPKTSKNNNSLF